MKTCTKCKEEKEISFFYKDKSVKSGIGSRCKDCVKMCASQSQQSNKEHRKNYMKDYEKNNKESIIKNRRKYREDNRDYFREYHREYQVERRKNDNLFKIKHNIRNRLWDAFKNKNWKKDGSEKMLGASYSVVKEYLESLFSDRMSWDNYGRCVDGDCDNFWHIDHKIPLNTATTKEEMEELCHYTNLQPLWAIDNLRKPKF